MSNSEKNTPQHSSTTNAISFGTITFLIGILVSAITMYTFMEKRIEKAVSESIKLGLIDQAVTSNKAAAEERHKNLKDQIWQSDQDNRQKFLELNNRIQNIEIRRQTINQPGPVLPPSP